MGNGILLCYSYRDKSVGDFIYSDIKAEGIECWTTHHNLKNYPLGEELNIILNKIGLAVFILSNKTNSSSDALAVLKATADKKLPVIIVRIDEVLTCNLINKIIADNQNVITVKLNGFSELGKLCKKIKEAHRLICDSMTKKILGIGGSAVGSIIGGAAAGAVMPGLFSQLKFPKLKKDSLTEIFGECKDDKGNYISTTVNNSKVANSGKTQTITDIVNFSITTPKTLTQGNVYILNVWAHSNNELNKVLNMAKEIQSEEVKIISKNSVPVNYGSRITVRLAAADIIICDPEGELFWTGDICNAQFPITIPNNLPNGNYLGIVEFFIDGIKISKLHFTYEVASNESSITQINTTGKKIKSAFVSYASEDRDKVLGRIQGIQKIVPDIELFYDQMSLHSGENWRDRLEKEIVRRDTFYLFWSLAASNSKWVEMEWRTALQMKGIDFIDPIPLIPPDVVPPPKELADVKHFNDWVLAYIRSF